MVETCGNCGAKITSGGMFGGKNALIDPNVVQDINSRFESDKKELCGACVHNSVSIASRSLEIKLEKCNSYISNNSDAFPMMTLQFLPQNISYKIYDMITANISIGTGIFNEMSQGLSDIFGRVNSETGMALKANSGEAAARAIMAHKAIALGANCIIGVDIDYGVTNNNAATVNMQGTAIYAESLADVIDKNVYERAERLRAYVERASELRQRVHQASHFSLP